MPFFTNVEFMNLANTSIWAFLCKSMISSRSGKNKMLPKYFSCGYISFICECTGKISDKQRHWIYETDFSVLIKWSAHHNK